MEYIICIMRCEFSNYIEYDISTEKDVLEDVEQTPVQFSNIKCFFASESTY